MYNHICDDDVMLSALKYHTRGLYEHSVRTYITSVVKYCEKPENVHLRKKLGGSF